MLLTSSFANVRDLINIHPFPNDPESHLFLSLTSNKPIKSETLWHVTNNLKKRIQQMINDNLIADTEERDRLIFLLKTKKWNPYCFRHSSSDNDSEYLDFRSLNKKCGWGQASKQAATYLKNKFGKNIKRQILEHNGIPCNDDLRIKPVTRTCWDDKCGHMNALENKLCGKCGRPLTQQALDDIRAKENEKYTALEARFNKIERTMQSISKNGSIEMEFKNCTKKRMKLKPMQPFVFPKGMSEEQLEKLLNKILRGERDPALLGPVEHKMVEEGSKDDALLVTDM